MEIEALEKLIRSKDETADLAPEMTKYWLSFFRKPGYFAGQFKSKGLKVYSQVWDLSNGSFYCNCAQPSNPCSHGVDLFFRYKEYYPEFKVDEAEVFNWSDFITKLIPLDKQKSDFQSTAYKAKQSQQKDKSKLERLALMQTGCAMLEKWIVDVLGMGLAELKIKPYSFWENITKSLVNYKLNGLADRIWSIYPKQEEQDQLDWYNQAIHGLSDLYLFVRSMQDPNVLESKEKSLSRYAGVKVMTKELEQEKGMLCTAKVIDITTSYVDDLIIERCLWLAVEPAKVFYTKNIVWKGAYNRSTQLPFKVGQIVKGEFVPYEYEMRYFLKPNYTKVPLADATIGPIHRSFKSAFDELLTVLQQQLFLQEYCFLFQCSKMGLFDGKYFIEDEEGMQVELKIDRSDFYKIHFDHQKQRNLILKWSGTDLIFIDYFSNWTSIGRV